MMPSVKSLVVSTQLLMMETTMMIGRKQLNPNTNPGIRGSG